MVSFFFYGEEQDERRPTLTVGTNTEDQVTLVLEGDPPAPRITPDPTEARWNYACWIQNAYAVIGDSRLDPFGATLIESWVRSEGRWWEEPRYEDFYDEAPPTPAKACGVRTPYDRAWDDYIAMTAGTTEDFVRLAVEVARRLHSDGVIEAVFGRSVPIVIHELEYLFSTMLWTAAANPRGLADEFVDWVMAMYE